MNYAFVCVYLLIKPVWNFARNQGTVVNISNSIVYIRIDSKYTFLCRFKDDRYFTLLTMKRNKTLIIRKDLGVLFTKMPVSLKSRHVHVCLYVLLQNVHTNPDDL